MRRSFVVAVMLMLAASSGSAQSRGHPSLGVYFDEAGTIVIGYYSSSFSAVRFYLVARNLEQVGAVRFRLDMDPRVIVAADSLSLPPSTVVGSPQSGVRIDYDPVLVADDTGSVLLGEGDFILNGNGLTYVVEVLPHPDDAVVLVDAADGESWISAIGHSGWLYSPDPVEELRWSEVKALYR
ncbi:MAG: hypothetical protein IPH09_16855 [bacterium]|nr:hypothetical protein [bacterium]